ncbi:MAG: cysteine synthase A [Treponema sp.]|jgi:cysteine synthase A|nr:cysteine synthase A [Treponema sp.]
MGYQFNKITDLIGNTPLVRLNRMNDTETDILVKLESFNPMHSIKDRIALAMIEAAEKEGKLTKGSCIIEATSGNTGIGLAYIAAVKGYRIILTMPQTMSIERQKLLKALGAEVVLTDGKSGMKGAIEEAEKLAVSIPNSWIPRQFDNPANPAIHEKTTGPEIWNDTNGKIDILVGGVGTGGTLTGCSKFLKAKNQSIKVIAVEPLSSAVLSGGDAGSHKIQGIGAGFIPGVLEMSIIDEVLPVDEEKAAAVARNLARLEGIFAGISSGAALEAALSIARRSENAGKTIVVILPDTGERYLSTELWG